MAIDPTQLKPSELVRLLNSTDLGTVAEGTKVFRHRQQAGFRISPDGKTVNLFKYIAWLVDERHREKTETETRDYEAMKEAARARNAATGQTEELGFIPVDAPEKKLENIPLADGVYEIQARPSDLFWQDCHCRKLLTLKVGDGGTEITGLPVIQNLRREISPLNFQSVLKWNIVAEYAPADMRFAIWFSDTTPVDTTGQPDITINYFDGQGDYQTNYTQTAECYAAVAAITDTEIGQIAEIHLSWSTIPPISPPNQAAK